MLTPEQLKKIDPEVSLTDEELLEVRDSFYDLGQLIFEDWLEKAGGSKYPDRVLQKLEETNKLKSWSKQG